MVKAVTNNRALLDDFATSYISYAAWQKRALESILVGFLKKNGQSKSDCPFCGLWSG
jgi:hypothetical protein